jgi:hypothetical protein
MTGLRDERLGGLGGLGGFLDDRITGLQDEFQWIDILNALFLI